MDLVPKRDGLENPFFLYRADNKHLLLTDGKQDKAKLKALGDKWKALSSPEKQVYEDKAKKNKEANQARFDEWKESHPREFAEYEAAKAAKKRKNQDDGHEKKRGPKVKDKAAPKIARTAFAFFQQHVRSAVAKRMAAQLNVEKADNQQVMAKMGHLWALLDDERKATFERVHLLDIDRYNADLDKYKRNDYEGAVKEADDDDDDDSSDAPKQRRGRDNSSDDNNDDASVESISSASSSGKKSSASASSSSSHGHAKKKSKKK